MANLSSHTAVRSSLRNQLKSRYDRVRKTTETLCEPLQTEDFVVQPMDDVSPPKWHLGHTTWFFETNVLTVFQPGYVPFRETYNFIFNSYYESFGSRQPRPRRGHLSRPTVNDVLDYRRTINRRMGELIQNLSDKDWSEFHRLVEIGLQHEQQHQELLITDIKYIYAANPSPPSYCRAGAPHKTADAESSGLDGWRSFPGELVEIGHDCSGFSYDNERPRHAVYLQPFKIRKTLVRNGEYLGFMRDGGYRNFRFWLSDGWDWIRKEHVEAPLYWFQKGGDWRMFTLNGVRPVPLKEPVCHVSYYEADAFARWMGKRLPTEAEWERAADRSANTKDDGNFMEDRLFHPRTATGSRFASPEFIGQMLGDVWEWTSSAYLPYPGFKPEAGALAEYNGKFMSNQMVLRGGSCATPRDHIRSTYRNFFQCDKRWQFAGIRLADG